MYNNNAFTQIDEEVEEVDEFPTLTDAELDAQIEMILRSTSKHGNLRAKRSQEVVRGRKHYAEEED